MIVHISIGWYFLTIYAAVCYGRLLGELQTHYDYHERVKQMAFELRVKHRHPELWVQYFGKRK
jgi:hypothetical protein